MDARKLLEFLEKNKDNANVKRFIDGMEESFTYVIEYGSFLKYLRENPLDDVPVYEDDLADILAGKWEA